MKNGIIDNKYYAYCGICCINCYQTIYVGPAAKALCSNMKKIGYEKFGHSIPDFDTFWNFLNHIVDEDGCKCCKSDGGNPYCKIRICAKEKKVEACAFCEDYPCKEFNNVFKLYPILEEDNIYLKENGFNLWSEMQKKRRMDGYTYTKSLPDYKKNK